MFHYTYKDQRPKTKDQRSIYFRFIPFNRSAQSFFERSLRAEAEFFKCARYIKRATRLPVGFVCSPSYLALESGESRNHLNKVSNQDLAPVAKIHGRALVVITRRQDNAFGAIFDIKKLARGVARS